MPCLSHLHPLDCLSSFFCWRNARIITNCHFVSSICRLISQSLYFNLITQWWYPGQINVSAVLYATVLDFRKHPLWVTLFLSIMLALGSLGRDQGSQAPRGTSAQYKNSHFLGIFLCGGYSLQTCRLDEPGVCPSWRAFFHFPHVPTKTIFSARANITDAFDFSGCSSYWEAFSSSSVDLDPKSKKMVVTLWNYISNSKYPYKSHCLRHTEKPLLEPSQTTCPAMLAPSMGTGPSPSLFLLIFTKMLWPQLCSSTAPAVWAVRRKG